MYSLNDECYRTALLEQSNVTIFTTYTKTNETKQFSKSLWPYAVASRALLKAIGLVPEGRGAQLI